jgi:MSHA biogenesis protein MshM
MYLRHFKLRELPFGLTPDTGFFFSSRSSQEALNTLLIALHSGEGFIKVSGEVGTGKTMLCRKLLSSLGADFKVALVLNPYVEPTELYAQLVSELGLDCAADAAVGSRQMNMALTQRLLNLAHDDKRVVVCVDEAQAMPLESLEVLRLLTNLETEKRKLLQVVVFGQPELDRKLDQPSARQIKQRITFEYQLSPLSRSELDLYLRHRLAKAGFQGPPLFTRPATFVLARLTRRVPRLINIVAHKSMLAAYGKGKVKVGAREILAAAEDTGSTSRLRRWMHASFVLFGLMGACVAATAWVYLR